MAVGGASLAGCMIFLTHLDSFFFLLDASCALCCCCMVVAVLFGSLVCCLFVSGPLLAAASLIRLRDAQRAVRDAVRGGAVGFGVCVCLFGGCLSGGDARDDGNFRDGDGDVHEIVVQCREVEVGCAHRVICDVSQTPMGALKSVCIMIG